MLIVKILLFIIFAFQLLPCLAYQLDTSVDDEIRRNYNPSKLEQTLPRLPKTQPTKIEEKVVIPKNIQKLEQVKNVTNSYAPVDKSTAIRIKKGTKFRVQSNSNLSDATYKGARFTFTSLSPVTQRYITIPAGTVFRAVVTDSHTPQVSGNGGLLEIMVDGIVVNGRNYPAQAKITKANHKKIFINNIKGKRQYMKGVAKQVNKGENFYKKSRRLSSKLADNPVGIIISPIPTVVGMGVYAANFVGSPIFSLANKGGKVSLPAGTEFEIKLLEDIYLQY